MLRLIVIVEAERLEATFAAPLRVGLPQLGLYTREFLLLLQGQEPLAAGAPE